MADFPIRAVDVSREWLQETLGPHFPDARLSSVEVAKAHSGTTGRARLALQWDSGGDTLPSTLFLKLPPDDVGQQDMVVDSGMGKREARFYAELAADLPVPTMEVYYSSWSPDGRRYLMVMEDIRARDGRPANGRQDRTLQVAEDLMRSLGSMHGRFWESPRFAADLNWLDVFSVRSSVGHALVTSAQKIHSDAMPGVFEDACQIYLQRNEGLATLFESGPSTLIHGDLHLGNLYRQADGAVGCFDWALVSRMPGMWDVSYVLCNSFPPEFRRMHEQQLLKLYIEALNEGGGPRRSLHDIWAEYRLYALYPWISAVATLGAGSRMQPEAVALRAVDWTQQALQDLDSIGFITASLNQR